MKEHICYIFLWLYLHEEEIKVITIIIRIANFLFYFFFSGHTTEFSSPTGDRTPALGSETAES